MKLKEVKSFIKCIYYDSRNRPLLSGDLVLISIDTYFKPSFAIAEYIKIGNDIKILFHIYSDFPYHMLIYDNNKTRYHINKICIDELAEISKQEFLFLKKRHKSVLYRSNWNSLPELVTDLPEKYSIDSGFASYIGLQYNNHVDFLYLNKKEITF